MIEHSDLIEQIQTAAEITGDELLQAAASALSSQSLSLSEAIRAEREACAQAVERRAAELDRKECCGRGISSGYSAPECCADPDYMISAFEAAAVIRARSALENQPAGLADAHSNPPLSDLSSLRKGAEIAVKPLEWDERPGDQFCRTFWQAKGCGGHYVVEVRHTGDFDMWLPETANGVRLQTLEAAKSAAQSDFETRIRSVLVSGSREDGE